MSPCSAHQTPEPNCRLCNGQGVSQHTPEPWAIRHTRTQIDGRIEDTYSVGDGGIFTEKEEAEIAVTCVNACAGMSDPAKEIAQMRQILRRIISDGCEIAQEHGKSCLQVWGEAKVDCYCPSCLAYHTLGLGGGK